MSPTRSLVALAILLAACSGSSEDTTTTTQATTTTKATTTTTEATTTTTIDTRPRSLINGLPIDEPDLLERRVVSVKIDNHWNAQPQIGILDAEAVFEIRVEGGITRLMAVFHTTDSELVGPVRSGRPSDAALVRPLESVLAISGGQGWVRAGIDALGVPYISDSRPGMFRVTGTGRSSPHNLFASTIELREVADGRDIPDEGPPGPLWEFGEMPEDAEEASEVSFVFSSTTRTTWVWDGTTYIRSSNGELSTWVTQDEEVEPISAEVLVAIVGRQYTASGSSGSSVPATETVGTGPFYVFAEGRVLTGTWEREEASDPFVLTTEDGEELAVPPGWAWISVIGDAADVVIWDNPPVTTTTTSVTTTTTGG